MNDPHVSPAKRLLDAAKGDGPSAAARAKIWSGVVSGAAGISASGASAQGASNAAAASASGKLVAIGALFGSAITVGIAATLLGFGPSPVLRPDPPVAPSTVAPTFAPPAAFGGSAPSTLPSSSLAGADTDSARARSDHGERHGEGAAHGRAATNDRGVSHRTAEDELMRESALVAEARGALIRGDATSALASLRVVKALKHRELEPEALSIEAHALRALGRDADALAVESALRTRFPDHALAR